MFNNKNSLRLDEAWYHALNKVDFDLDPFKLNQAKVDFYDLGETVLNTTPEPRLVMDRVWVKQSRVRALRIIEGAHQLGAPLLTIPDDFLDDL